MSEEPVFPPIPSIGEVLTRKKNMKEIKTTILKCKGCGNKTIRPFKEGDYVFKIIEEINCTKCLKKEYSIIEIFAEFKKTNENKRNIKKKKN